MKALRLIPLALLLAFASCRTAQEAEQSTAPSSLSAEAAASQYKQRVAENAVKSEHLTARISMEISLGQKDLSVNGTLRMKRNDVVQLSLTFLGMEVGRMEFTPGDVLIIDRFNKQYVRASYDDISFLKKNGLDFSTVQALFWNELFLPGEKISKTSLHRFTLTKDGQHTLLSLNDAPQLGYQFQTLTESARLNATTVKDKQHPQRGTLQWTYADFKDFKGQAFPTSMSIRIERLGKNAGFTIRLSRLDNDSNWQTRTSVSGKYKEQRADDILQKLLSL